MCAQQPSSDHAEFTRKSRRTEDESKRHENKKGSDINFVLGKNGGHRPVTEKMVRVKTVWPDQFWMKKWSGWTILD